MAWNINAGEQFLAELEQNARNALAEVGPVDVAMLQEVISKDQVAAIARGFSLDHWAISDFSPPVDITGAWFRSLEVAVISRTSIRFAAEWDPTGRAPNGDNFPPRVSDPNVMAEKLPINVAFAEDTFDRGFLRVDLDGDLSVYAVHWKSSRGENCTAADMVNAQQREEQAMGPALDAGRVPTEGATVIVGGDFNMQAPGRSLRVGSNPKLDCAPTGRCDGLCGPDGLDGYDDSIAILFNPAPNARLLSAELDNTFIARFFPGGAIDHLVVAGARAAEFELATTPSINLTSFFGSHHRPMLTQTIRDAPGTSKQARIRAFIPEISERLGEVEALTGAGNDRFRVEY